MKVLTAKQKLFVEHYLATNNATEAAKMAGYECKSEGSARVMGSKLLNNPAIDAAITDAVERRVIEADEVLNGIREIALNTSERAGDRLRAFELLGRYLNLFVERQKHEHSGGVTIEVEYIRPDAN